MSVNMMACLCKWLVLVEKRRSSSMTDEWRGKYLDFYMGSDSVAYEILSWIADVCHSVAKGSIEWKRWQGTDGSNETETSPDSSILKRLVKRTIFII